MSVKEKTISDEQLVRVLQETVDLEDAFSATRSWSLKRVRQSIRSRGDYFDRNSTVIFEMDGQEVLRVAIGVLPVMIGRGEKADYRLDYEGISRVHCWLEVSGNLVRLCDAGSKNGTLLNGKRIDGEDLCDGDDVQIGSISVRVRRG